MRTYSPLDTNDSEWQIAQTSLQFLVTPDHFMSGKLKIRCSASIYDIYWQSTEVSAEEERPRVIQLEPAATIVGINYLQPPPNFQTGQRKPDGHLDVKGKRPYYILSNGTIHMTTPCLHVFLSNYPFLFLSFILFYYYFILQKYHLQLHNYSMILFKWQSIQQEMKNEGN